MEQVIFKNLNITYREEAFGGILFYNSRFFMLNCSQLKFIKAFKGYKYYSQLSNEEKIIVNQFLEWQIFLKMDEEKAIKIIERKRNPNGLFLPGITDIIK